MYIFLLLSLFTKTTFGANILFINPVESVSHHIWNEELIQGLLKKGHNITLMGHKDTKIQSENYTVLRIRGFDNLYDDIVLGDQQLTNIVMDFVTLWKFMTLTCEIHLKSDALKTILSYPRDKFDLIIFDITSGHGFYPLIGYFGYPPVVGTTPFFLAPFTLDTMGSHFYFNFPVYHLPYTDKMTFLQRVENTLLYLLEYSLKWYYMPGIYKMAQARYGEDIDPFDQVEKKVGILLTNYDPVLDYPHPLPPSIIPVGGLHVKRSEKLSNDLQRVLDNANSGAIFFSFGTIIQPSWLSAETKKIFLNVFSKLNQTVLWKYTADDLEDIPKNVIIRKWFPQNDVLAHKNVKLFITHSGGLSNHETIYHGVPVLGFPFFGDQKVIAGKMVGKELGKRLYISDLTEYILYETILELLNNPIYKQNIMKTSQLFRDQKETPLERAVFWVEYALRNKDLNHLSTNARNMTLFQRENLDVYGAILLATILLLISFFAILKCIIVRYLIFDKKLKIKQN